MIAPMSLRTLAMATLVVATPFISACEVSLSPKVDGVPFGKNASHSGSCRQRPPARAILFGCWTDGATNWARSTQRPMKS
jgi:hypothetical protein